MKRWEEDERKRLPDEGRQESKADNVVRSGNGGYAVMSTKTLYIRMFGGFTIHYGDKAVALNHRGVHSPMLCIVTCFIKAKKVV